MLLRGEIEAKILEELGKKNFERSSEDFDKQTSTSRCVPNERMCLKNFKLCTKNEGT